jgi:hypothetical protein
MIQKETVDHPFGLPDRLHKHIMRRLSAGKKQSHQK